MMNNNALLQNCKNVEMEHLPAPKCITYIVNNVRYKTVLKRLDHW